MKKDRPIISTLLDTDFYKFTISQFAYLLGEHGSNVVSYKFHNRTNVNLLDYIDFDELKEELDNLKSLRFSYKELKYLESRGLTPDYLDELSNIPVEINLTRSYNRINLTVSGQWMYATLYESAILAIINELYNRSICRTLNSDESEAAIDRNINKKIEFLKANPNIKFLEFGTRRRKSLSNQKFVIRFLKNQVKDQLLGTSNVHLAMKYDLEPNGTVAHEVPMYFAAKIIAKDQKYFVTQSQIEALKEWIKIYPDTYWLTDTYGTEHFLSKVLCPDIKVGLRQDSGDPMDFVKRVIKYGYKDRKLVFSDGLTPEKITYIHYKCCRDNGIPEENVTYGWGTNLTNHGLVNPLSIVLKLDSVKVNDIWNPAVKLSDNIAKAKGDAIEVYKHLFEYTDTYNEKCIY